MANQCLNVLMVSTDEDADALVRFRQRAQDPTTPAAVLSFNRFVPVPEDQNGSEYEWCQHNWGTGRDAYDSWITFSNERTVMFIFITRWHPPLQWLRSVIAEFETLEFTLQYVDYTLPRCGVVASSWGRVLTEAHSGVSCCG